MKLKIRSQLLLAFGVVLGLVLISSTVVFWKATEVSGKLEHMKTARLPELIKGDAVALNLMKARSDVRQAFLFISTGATTRKWQKTGSRSTRALLTCLG